MCAVRISRKDEQVDRRGERATAVQVWSKSAAIPGEHGHETRQFTSSKTNDFTRLADEDSTYKPRKQHIDHELIPRLLPSATDNREITNAGEYRPWLGSIL